MSTTVLSITAMNPHNRVGASSTSTNLLRKNIPLNVLNGVIANNQERIGLNQIEP